MNAQICRLEGLQSLSERASAPPQRTRRLRGEVGSHSEFHRGDAEYAEEAQRRMFSRHPLKGVGLELLIEWLSVIGS